MPPINSSEPSSELTWRKDGGSALLTDARSERLRDDVYEAIHDGSAEQWAASNAFGLQRAHRAQSRRPGRRADDRASVLIGPSRSGMVCAVCIGLRDDRERRRLIDESEAEFLSRADPERKSYQLSEEARRP
ncbi:MAG TPA: hypothetical protein VM121_09460 [Acidimicrobiales bacterium]|nr:hypothetical protein [Acidimicrobiales bacterium]